MKMVFERLVKGLVQTGQWRSMGRGWVVVVIGRKK